MIRNSFVRRFESEEIESVGPWIAAYDRQIQQIAPKDYSQVSLLHWVKGVGILIALTYLLTLEELAPISPRPGHRLFSGVASQALEFGAAASPRDLRTSTNRWEVILSGTRIHNLE